MPKQPAPPPPAPTAPPPAVVEVPEPPITLDPIPPPIALEEPAPEPPTPPVEKTPLQWAKEKDIKRWQLAGAAAGERWASDKILSEVDFDAAIKRALGAQSG